MVYLSGDCSDYLCKDTGGRKPNLTIWTGIIAFIVWASILYSNRSDDNISDQWIIFIVAASVALSFVSFYGYEEKQVFTKVRRREFYLGHVPVVSKYMDNAIYQEAAEELYEQMVSDREIDYTMWREEFQNLNQAMSELPEARKLTPSAHNVKLNAYKKDLEALPSVDY